MHRYFPHTEKDIKEMLKVVGVSQIDDLFVDIPKELRIKGELDLPSSLSEAELLEHLRSLANQNQVLKVFKGDGAYDHYAPVVIDTLLSRQEFTTSYTPYQPEISQGTLQYIFEFQSMICELTGMDVSNASMYDGVTSASEAMFMMKHATRRNKILVSSTVSQRILSVVETYAKYRDVEIVLVNEENGVTSLKDVESKMNQEVAGIIYQTPNCYGIIEDGTKIAEAVHVAGGLVTSYVNPHALALLKTPREMGSDIAVGDGQSLGIPLNFGGPYVGFMATVESLMRKMPGRICGMSQDVDGKRAFVLTLQAREQHIRREKANSNICSNQSLMALYVTMYLSLMGKQGMREIASRSYKGAHYLAQELIKTKKFTLTYDQPFFQEFLVKTDLDIELLNRKLLEKGILGGSKVGDQGWLLCISEKLSKQEIDSFVSIVGGL